MTSSKPSVLQKQDLAFISANADGGHIWKLSLTDECKDVENDIEISSLEFLWSSILAPHQRLRMY